ncbi:hypothetical protein ACP4OV_017180 [Aristida adscensionis]
MAPPAARDARPRLRLCLCNTSPPSPASINPHRHRAPSPCQTQTRSARKGARSPAAKQMAMERLATAMAFCEAPLDAYGTSVAAGQRDLKAAGVGAAAAHGGAGDHQAATPEVAKGGDDASVGSPAPARRRAECAPALDGLNCFETVVMH